jgi:tetratricopeptide (TPR) repeat protein
VKGFAEHRLGRFPEAVDWLQKVVLQTNDVERTVQAHAVLAMAQHRLGRKEEARAALANATGLADTRLGKPGSGTLDEQWHDWIIAHLLIREASELIGLPPATGAEVK